MHEWVLLINLGVTAKLASAPTVGTFVGILLQKSAKLWVVPTVLENLMASARH